MNSGWIEVITCLIRFILEGQLEHNILAHFWPVSHIYIPWKHKTQVFCFQRVERWTQPTFTFQSQQWKHQNNMWNLFDSNNKDIKTTSLTSFGVFVTFEQYLTHCSAVSIVDSEQANADRETLALNRSIARITCLVKKSYLATRV